MVVLWGMVLLGVGGLVVLLVAWILDKFEFPAVAGLSAVASLLFLIPAVFAAANWKASPLLGAFSLLLLARAVVGFKWYMSMGRSDARWRWLARMVHGSAALCTLGLSFEALFHTILHNDPDTAESLSLGVTFALKAGFAAAFLWQFNEPSSLVMLILLPTTNVLSIVIFVIARVRSNQGDSPLLTASAMGTMAIVPPALATIAMKFSGASETSIDVQDDEIFSELSDKELLIHDVATAFDLTTFAVSALVPIQSSIASAPGPVFWPCILATIACIPLVFLLNFKQFYGVLVTGLGWLAGLLVPATVALAVTALEAGEEGSGHVDPAHPLGALETAAVNLTRRLF